MTISSMEATISNDNHTEPKVRFSTLADGIEASIRLFDHKTFAVNREQAKTAVQALRIAAMNSVFVAIKPLEWHETVQGTWLRGEGLGYVCEKPLTENGARPTQWMKKNQKLYEDKIRSTLMPGTRVLDVEAISDADVEAVMASASLRDARRHLERIFHGMMFGPVEQPVETADNQPAI